MVSEYTVDYGERELPLCQILTETFVFCVLCVRLCVHICTCVVCARVYGCVGQVHHNVCVCVLYPVTNIVTVLQTVPISGSIKQHCTNNMTERRKEEFIFLSR